MPAFFERVNGKIVAIITVVLIGIVGLILAISSHVSTHSQSSQGSGQIQKSPKPSAKPVAKKFKDPVPQAYLSDDFAINYPGNWHGQQEALVGGQQVTFIPSVQSSFPPSISVTYDSTPKTIADRTKYYTDNGFQQSTVYVGAHQWTKVSGVNPAQGVFAVGSTQKVFESDLFTTYQGQTYTISYKYQAARQDKVIEGVFQNILNSFEFF